MCGDEETSFEHNCLCVQYTHLHSRQLCTAHVHICVKSVQMMKLNMIMHLRRYDKRILLEELCPGNLSPFCFTIFSHSSKIQQINELFLFVSCKMKESGTPTIFQEWHISRVAPLKLTKTGQSHGGLDSAKNITGSVIVIK